MFSELNRKSFFYAHSKYMNKIVRENETEQQQKRSYKLNN